MSWVFYAILGMIIQGTILFLVKLFSARTNPLTILFFQYFGSLIITSIYLTYKKISVKLKKEALIKVLLSSFLISTGLSFYYLAISLQEASLIVPLHNIGITLIPVLLGFTLLKEKYNVRTILGVLLAIISITLITV